MSKEKWANQIKTKKEKDVAVQEKRKKFYNIFFSNPFLNFKKKKKLKKKERQNEMIWNNFFKKIVEKKKLIKSLFDKYFYIVMLDVKTPWKQERQVCVDMQKIVQMKNKELEKKIIELTVEIDKLKVCFYFFVVVICLINIVGMFNKKNQELELKADLEQITILRKEKVKKVNIDNLLLLVCLFGFVNFFRVPSIKTGYLENEKRSLLGDLNRLQTELIYVKTQNEDLNKNIDAIKSGISETRTYKHNIASQLGKKKYLLKYKDDVKRLKEELSEKETELQKEVEAKRASDQHRHSEQTKMKKKKLKYLKKQLKYQKSNFKEELHSVKAQAKADLYSLAEKNGQRRIIRGSNERIVKLDDELNEARNTGENLSGKSTALSDELKVIKKEKADLSGHVEKLKEELKEKELSAQNAESEASNKINKLEKELVSRKEISTNEINSVYASNRKLSDQIDCLKKEFYDKSSKRISFADKLRQAIDDIVTLRNSESSLKGQ
ncbi:hypothetical protein RFI_30833, partial [Reticulomyxa filosa]